MLEKDLRKISPGQPLYIRLYEHLRQYIDTEPARKIGKLPTEMELCRIFKVSRNTVTQALSMLENEQLICRIKHRGTFLTSAINEFDPQSIRRTIGAVFPDSPSWGETISAIKNCCRIIGYDFKHYTYSWHDPEDELRVLTKAKKRSGGLILYPGGSGMDSELIREMASNYPLVLFDLHVIGFECNCVSTDHFQGAYALVTELIRRNCRKFCLLTDSRPLSTINQRQHGYIQALQDHGITPDQSCFYDHGYSPELIEHLQNGGFDAVLDCSRHVMASGIPGKKIYFARFDQIEPEEKAAFHTVAVVQNKKEIGTQAANLLKIVLRSGASPGRKILISPTIHFYE